jgi:thiol-disulfide isomerase/thioredoxin
VTRQLLPLLLVAVLAAVVGFFAARHFAGDVASAPEGVGALVGQARPDFRHADLDGRVREAADFDGSLTLVNFWATWCAPCVEEMPMLSELQEAYRGRGLRVVGIALDERERAARFARELGLSYPVLLGEADVVVTSRRFGNSSGMLPYSVLIDTNGVIRWVRLGALERAELERIILENLPSA